MMLYLHQSYMQSLNSAVGGTCNAVGQHVTVWVSEGNGQ